jgi:hypothetical protein
MITESTRASAANFGKSSGWYFNWFGQLLFIDQIALYFRQYVNQGAYTFLPLFIFKGIHSKPEYVVEMPGRG